MKLIPESPFADPEAAARKLVELASSLAGSNLGAGPSQRAFAALAIVCQRKREC